MGETTINKWFYKFNTFCEFKYTFVKKNGSRMNSFLCTAILKSGYRKHYKLSYLTNILSNGVKKMFLESNSYPLFFIF